MVAKQPAHPATVEADSAPVEPKPELPWLTLREPLPPVIATPDALAAACAELRSEDGPIAIDAERASGYRYSARAYLVQLRRGSGPSHLIDPTAFDDLGDLPAVLAEAEWILHAATQDLPCLKEIGLIPTALFDTELAARLLGLPRVGLAGLVEELLGQRLRKEHSAVDWSTRPLPEPWLEYAALDVEVLIELRELISTRLDSAGKLIWAKQEFAHLLNFTPTQRIDPWRRTSGAHRLKSKRMQGAVRELWLTRDEIAADLDVSPSRLLPDSAIVAAAEALPGDKRALFDVVGFHGRGAKRHSDRWIDAIRKARTMPEAELPTRPAREPGPPHPRAWADRDPVAAARLVAARESIAKLSEQWQVPIENLLSPDLVRRLMWQPPSQDELGPTLRDAGARDWQIELVGPALAAAIDAADS